MDQPIQVSRGGFTGDPTSALHVAGSDGCCAATVPAGDRAASVPAGDRVAAGTAEVGVATAPCCGTRADADAAGRCCSAPARAQAVAAGTGCCS